jgi:hypothetical protein
MIFLFFTPEQKPWRVPGQLLRGEMGNAHSATATALSPPAGGKSVDSESDDDVQDLGLFKFPLSNRERNVPVARRDEAPLDSDDENVFVSHIEQIAVATASRVREQI